MKKWLVVTLAIVVLLAGCSPSSGVNSSVERQEGYDEGYAVGYAAGYSAASVPAESPDSEPAPTVAQGSTPEPVVSDIGTRKNPARVGQAVQIVVDAYRGKGNVTMTLKQVIRGDEAWSIIYDANQFNTPPTDTHEYLMAMFEVTFNLDTSGEDEALELDKLDFAYSTGEYSIQKNVSIVHPKPEFATKLYEGASTEGWVCLFIEKRDNNPMAVFLDDIWFKLT